MSNLTQKKNRSSKNRDKDGKKFHRLIKNIVYGKTVEKLKNRIDVRLVSKE